jgi:hypothetical protein
VVWKLIGGIAAGAGYLVGRNVFRRSHQDAAAKAAGLAKADDLSHLPQALQRTALWALSDGGFERRVVHGTLAREHGDIELTAFDLETLRERRGEWAFLPVAPPFRIGGLVSVVVCEVDRRFPHVLLKRAGRGDEMIDDSRVERAMNVAKVIRDRLGVKRSYESEMPDTLPREAIATTLPAHWRVYTRAPELVTSLVAAGLPVTLEAANRRDLVVELFENLVVVYPAARDVAGPDALADLTATALTLADGVLAATPSLTPRGIDSLRGRGRSGSD